MSKGKPRRPRPAPGGQPPLWSQHIYLRVAPADLAYLKFLLESEDNLAYLTIVDKFTAIARVTFSPGQAVEVREFLSRARGEMDLRQADTEQTENIA